MGAAGAPASAGTQRRGHLAVAVEQGRVRLHGRRHRPVAGPEGRGQCAHRVRPHHARPTRRVDHQRAGQRARAGWLPLAAGVDHPSPRAVVGELAGVERDRRGGCVADVPRPGAPVGPGGRGEAQPEPRRVEAHEHHAHRERAGAQRRPGRVAGARQRQAALGCGERELADLDARSRRAPLHGAGHRGVRRRPPGGRPRRTPPPARRGRAVTR
jgi:hypothetical protein